MDDRNKLRENAVPRYHPCDIIAHSPVKVGLSPPSSAPLLRRDNIGRLYLKSAHLKPRRWGDRWPIERRGDKFQPKL